MATRIEVAYREGIRDVPGEKLRNRLRRDLDKDIIVHVVDVYTVDAPITGRRHREAAARTCFIDPVLQEGYVGTPVIFDADWVIEVGFKPGVTDNVGRTAREVIEAVSRNLVSGGRRRLHLEDVLPQGKAVRGRDSRGCRRHPRQYADQPVCLQDHGGLPKGRRHGHLRAEGHHQPRAVSSNPSISPWT